jgi:hypothetical protein
MIAAQRHRDPAHVLEQQQRALGRLRQFHALNLGRLQNAEQALAEFRSTIERKESEWRIALAIEEATAALDPQAAETLLQGLLADTALRIVQERFNAVFAELDVQMSSVDAPTRTLLDAPSLQRMDAIALTELAGLDTDRAGPSKAHWQRNRHELLEAPEPGHLCGRRRPLARHRCGQRLVRRVSRDLHLPHQLPLTSP